MSLYEKFLKFLKWPRQSTNYFHYTAVVLDYFDKLKLLARFSKLIPKGWQITAEHMTVNVGKADEGPATSLLNKKASLRIVSIAYDDKVMAVGVETDIPSNNPKKHITLAYNPEGGSSKDSNNLTNWEPIDPFVLKGTLLEVAQKAEQQAKAPKEIKPLSAPAPDDPKEFVRELRAQGKPDQVIKMAMKGKFKNLSPEEIEKYVV